MPLFLFVLSCAKEPARVATKGDPAPDFKVESPDGAKLRLSDLRGKVVLVNFWATWCPSCVEEKPYMLYLVSLLRDSPDFRFVSILYRDDINNALMYQKSHSAVFPVYMDPQGKAALSYGLTGVPESFVIDKTGILREKVIGPENWASPQVLGYFQSLLRE